MDPHTSTRAQFTDALVSTPIPDSATQAYKDLAQKLKTLLRLLADHKGMEENLGQTYMTPANYKNKIYFMWDFIGRTLGQLYVLDPSSARPGHPGFDEAAGRAKYAGQLMTTLGGMLDSMCPDERGEGLEFGGEIEGVGRGL